MRSLWKTNNLKNNNNSYNEKTEWKNQYLAGLLFIQQFFS